LKNDAIVLAEHQKAQISSISVDWAPLLHFGLVGRVLPGRFHCFTRIKNTWVVLGQNYRFLEVLALLIDLGVFEKIILLLDVVGESFHQIQTLVNH